MELTLILMLFAAVALTLVIPAVRGMRRAALAVETNEPLRTFRDA